MSLPRILFSAIVMAALSDCSSPFDPPAGGPCEYDITVSPATVIAVQPRDTMIAVNPAADSAWAEILFQVEKEGKTDTLYYTREFSGYASRRVREQYGLVKGSQFRYEHHVIKKGTCTPDMYFLRLVKF